MIQNKLNTKVYDKAYTEVELGSANQLYWKYI